MIKKKPTERLLNTEPDDMTKNGMNRQIFYGLKALSEAAFPKRCPTCDRIYVSAEDFFHQTRSVRDGISGLKCAQDERDNTVVELFRNCLCGSTLMDYFDDRRDITRQGLKRRVLFGSMMQMLKKNGMTEDQARAELLNVLRGETSPLLAAMGIDTRVM